MMSTEEKYDFFKEIYNNYIEKKDDKFDVDRLIKKAENYIVNDDELYEKYVEGNSYVNWIYDFKSPNIFENSIREIMDDLKNQY